VNAHETLSEAWLKKAQSAVNADPSFRKRGSIDVKMAVKSDKSTYLVTFGGFSCHDVRTMTDAGLRDADFAIDMSDDLTLGCILFFDADRHLLAQLPITQSGGAAVEEWYQVDVPGVPRFATVLNADGDVIGGGPIEDHSIRLRREFAQDLISRLDAE